MKMTTTVTKAAAPKISQHIGKVGDLIRVEGVVRKIFDFGITLVHDADGNEFAVKARKLASRPGVLVIFEGVVAKHSEYKGVKRTEISSYRQEMVDDADADRISAALHA